MLSALLKSKTAVEISIKIIDAFVAMRRFLSSNAQIFERLDRIEIKQLEYDKKFNDLFNALEKQEQNQGIFFDGQIFDAYAFVSSLIRKAKKG